jgi:3-hydroxyisobutyrate dehydrogenase-like beta-hydroxyacid dehydrogenase
VKVAVIGVGRMGSAIAEAILAAGFDLTVYARTASKAQPLAALGARLAASVADAASEADVVLTSLRDDASVTEVVRAEGGLLDSMRSGAVHAGATTISPALSDRLAAWHEAAGSRYVAAPVVGRRERVFEHNLVTFAAGRAEDIEVARPVLEALGTVRVVGPRHSSANVLKLLNNFITAAWLELMGEVYALAERNDISREEAHDLLVWALGKKGLRDYAAEIRDRAFDDAGFELTTGLKDVELMLQAGAESGVELPYAAVVRERMLAAIDRGLGQKDWAALAELALSSRPEPPSR